MSVLASSVNPGSRAMSPITTYPQSGGDALEQSNNFYSKRTASPQGISNGYSTAKSSSILSPRKTSKRFFKRPTLERNHLVDPQLQGNEKRKHFHSQPKVEIIYKDSPSESESDKETIIESLKKNFEVHGTRPVRPSSTHSGEWSPPLMSDESAPSTPINRCLDMNMNQLSMGSNISHIDRVVQEIVTTEQTYVAHLEEIIEGYLKKMRKENSPVNKQDIKDLFMNIEEIYEFNKAFLSELEECREDPVEVALKFASKEEGFAIYTEYCTNYPMSVEVLTKLTQRKETAEFIKYIQVGLGHSLPLGSYLLKPVQRILKYHLLLEDIQKHFDKASDTEGYDIVSDALCAMTGVAKHINEMKRQHEVTVHVQEIQSQMSDFEGPDLTTYGHLILEDSFRVHGTRSDRYLFLFQKILLITKRKETGYSCKGTLMLSNMMILESVPKEPLVFQIIRFNNQKVSYTFLARNAEQKNVWTLELKKLILDSLPASVPKKAKDLILGDKSLREKTDAEASDWDSKKRSGSFDSRPNRGLPPKEKGSSRVLVTITADFVDVKPQQPSYNINNTANRFSELDLKRLNHVSHVLANRNACWRLYQTLAKQNNMLQVVVNKRLSDPHQGSLKHTMNFHNNHFKLLLESSSGYNSLPRNFVYNQGSSSRYTGNRRDPSRKSDDEGEPRSPTDVYSSDDDKKRVSWQPHQASTENSLGGSEEPSREKPPEIEMTDMEASQSSVAPADVQEGDWKRRLSSQNDTNCKVWTMVNESSEEEDQEEDVHESETPAVEQGKMYVVEDAQGTILGSSGIQPSSVSEEKEIAQEDSFVSHNEGTQEVNTNSVKVAFPVVRGRSGSYSEGDTLKVSRNCSVTEGGDGDVTNELGKLGFARVRSDGPGRVPKRTSSLKLLEARRNSEKSTSALDLRDMDEDSSAVFNDKEITSFVEYSAIQKTVRKVNLAFSGSPTPTEKSPPSELDMRVGQTRSVVESPTLEKSPSDKDISVSTSDSSHHSLEEMLASIDRDLEDTRRTISCAQLLESALLIKNESKPLVSQPTENLSRRRRARLIDFSINSGDSCHHDREINSSIDKDVHIPVSPCENAARHQVHSFSIENRQPRRGVANVSESSRTEKAKLLNKEQYLRHDIKTHAKPSHKAGVSHANHVEDKHNVGKRVRTDSHHLNRRAFELFTDASHDENNVFANKNNRASNEAKRQVVIPARTKLPNVYQMARRYSQKVTETTTVENIRMRARNDIRERDGSVTSDKEDNALHTPRIKIERVTKVSLNNTPIEAYKIVRRRKRRSGSSRHRSEDVRRSSWSIEKVKPDTEGPRKERPKSVYDMEALEAKLTESMEQIEEDLEPMLMEGLEKDDVVVRGLVQHLVGKFNAQRTNATS